MDPICTQYGRTREPDTRVDRAPEPRTPGWREAETRVDRPHRERDTEVRRPPARRRFVITVPQHLAQSFGISPSQVEADLYVIDCNRRPLPRR